MTLRILVIIYLCLLTGSSDEKEVKYKPTWESLDARPIPSWYDEAKVGIFIHWGVFSVPSFGSEWFWINWKRNSSQIVEFMRKNYPPGFSYQEFASQFTGEFFDPVKWAQLFEASGAKYIIFTSKHHEGYAMWPSVHSYSWNSVDVGPHKDVIGELATAVRKYTNLRFGLYHSLFEWFNPLYISDRNNNWTTHGFVNTKIIPEMKELVHLYKPDLIWSDGEWEAPDTYWKSKEFLTWLYNESPVKNSIVVNDRWGSNTLCKHGGFLTCSDRFNPGHLIKRKWENALTIDLFSWGYRRNADISDFLTAKEMITYLAQAVSCNGNVAFNVGPTKEGVISPIYQERLLLLGSWLSENGKAVYGTRPWNICQNDTQTSGVWYTKKTLKNGSSFLYAIVLEWPSDNKLILKCPQASPNTEITFIPTQSKLTWSKNSTSETLEIDFPVGSKLTQSIAWTLKMSEIVNLNSSVTVKLQT